jgi:cytochrome c oxidase assembly protein subunit 15
MAVPDWPTTFGQNMFTYPLSEMLANSGVFWEHGHRLWGALVGVAVVALAAVAWRFEPRRGVRILTTLAVLGVVAQGVLGGLRVTENSPELAFLHGAFAQALFALLAAVLLLESQAWRGARAGSLASASRLRTLSLFAAPAIYVQTVFGAWLRHSGSQTAQAVHVLFAIVAAWVVLRLASELARSGDPVLQRIARWQRGLVWTQVLLGVLAWVAVHILTGPHRPVSISEAVFATAHVACGAMLLAACVAALVFVRRIAPAGASVGDARLETVR